jgi:oxygen-dependent protoporphyrinogen oxidase
MKKIVVVGSGISGLTAAYEVKKKIKEENLPIEVVLIEREKRLGGVFRTEKTEGFLIEAGPDSFETYKPAPLELARELGIEDRVIGGREESHRTFVFTRGELRELPRGLIGLVPDKISSLAFTPLLSLRGRLRASLELFTPRLERQGADISLAEFYKRRFGREIFDVVAEPLFGSIYACVPETISIKSCWPRGLLLEEEYGSLIRGMLAKRKETRKQVKKDQKKSSVFMTFKDGMSELTDALIAQIGNDTFVTGKAVTSLAVGSGDKRFAVLLEDGERVGADACILATSPAHVTADIVKSVDPGVSDMLLRIPFVSSATISLGYKREGFSHPLSGFGLLVARTEKKSVKAITWSSSKFEGRAPEGHVLIRCFVGNAAEETIVYRSDEEILRVVKEDLKDIMGINVEPVLTQIYRWRNSMAQYTLGHRERVAFIEERLKKFPGLHLIGDAYRGLGIGDCVNDGKRAATETLDYLKELN